LRKNNHTLGINESIRPVLQSGEWFVATVQYRPITSLGHQGGKSFLKRAHFFRTMSNTFSSGGKIFFSGSFTTVLTSYGPGAIFLCLCCSFEVLDTVL